MFTHCTAATVTQAVEEFLAAFPHKDTFLTDNDGAFTDRFAVHKQGKPVGQPSGTHRLDHLCRVHGITHRLIRPYQGLTREPEKKGRLLPPLTPPYKGGERKLLPLPLGEGWGEGEWSTNE